MITQILNDAISRIESQRQREVEVEKQRVMKEQIVPFNAEIDEALKNAINEKSAQLAQNISAFQARFEEERRTLIEAAEKKKADFLESTIATAVAVINIKYNDAVKNIKDYIDKQGE